MQKNSLDTAHIPEHLIENQPSFGENLGSLVENDFFMNFLTQGNPSSKARRY